MIYPEKKVKLARRKGIFFQRMADRRDAKQFSDMVSLSVF